ncbi:uncharacterized protein [Acropora muricata]|uniref:uncharacterized protein isoform X3 n=1 Tax=Acropora muricata TaxID=159855 RepID=UPI0034E43DCE
MSDEELDEVVKDIKKDFCQSGYRMVLGVLRSRGYRIQQRRVMESLRRVDVEGVIMRSLQLKIIHRREYRVYGPNALWHIDTNHKLIRHLSEFSQGWNNHGLSTERSKIPIQLWISGMFDMANSNHRAAREVWEPRTDDELMSFGIDWDGPAPSVECLQESNTQGITIPELLVPFPEDLNLLLSHLINPLRESSNHDFTLSLPTTTIKQKEI